MASPAAANGGYPESTDISFNGTNIPLITYDSSHFGLPNVQMSNSNNSSRSPSGGILGDSQCAIDFEFEKLFWPDGTPLLRNPKNIQFRFPYESFVCVVGATGSGKTGFLTGLIGELSTRSGVRKNVIRGKGLRYCAQTPWICNKTLKDNIMWGAASCSQKNAIAAVTAEVAVAGGMAGSPGKARAIANGMDPKNVMLDNVTDYDSGVLQNNIESQNDADALEAEEEERYQRTLECAALLPDLEILPNRDHTSIGDRGVNLSGGQKARVAIARAVYDVEQASVFVFDDVLSAVDSHVAAHLRKEMFFKRLKGKCIILATHDPQTIRMASHIVYIHPRYTSSQSNNDLSGMSTSSPESSPGSSGAQAPEVL